MRIPFTICRFCLQLAESAYNLQIPLTLCGFHLHLLIPQQLKFTEHLYYFYLFTDLTNLFRIPHIFRKVACSWSNFEQYSVLAICPWRPKQQRRSRKNCIFADSGTNLISACCGIRLQFTKCTVWPRNESLKKLGLKQIIKSPSPLKYTHTISFFVALRKTQYKAMKSI